MTEKQQLLDHPRQDRWSEHFAWNPDQTLIVGLTPTGRATVNRVRLNREELVNLRKVLVKDRVHPPAYPFDGHDSTDL